MTTAENQLRNEFTDDGWELFLRLLSEKTQSDLLRSKNFNYRVAIVDNEIIGVLASKKVNHLFHFFIHPKWQNQGVGRALWNGYLQNLVTIIGIKNRGIKKITVNASDFAFKFYLKIGFTIKHQRQIKNGICFTAMEYLLD